MGSDFNGDGRDDVLWRHRQNDIYTDWLGRADGGFTDNSGVFRRVVSSDWQVVGTGDFNGDGRDDILWRHMLHGEITDWLGAPNGGFDGHHANAAPASIDWYVVGIGDFNGDGRDDILWRHHTSGAITNWLSAADGAFVNNNANAAAAATDWAVVGTGDFNGDGRDDILWRHANGAIIDWLGTASGGFASNASSAAAVSANWNVIGTGDFNGDGRDDILWRHFSGVITNWLAAEGGGFTSNDASAVAVSLDWAVVATGDYNGDGKDDILWRNHEAVTDWLGSDSGAFVSNDAAAYASVDMEWIVQGFDQPNPGCAGCWDY